MNKKKLNPNFGSDITKFCILLFIINFLFISSLNAEKIEKITIDQAIKLALNNNHSIKEADFNIIAAEKGKKGAFTEYFFKIIAHYNYNSLKEYPISKASGIPAIIADKVNHHWDFQLIQPLFTGFALTAQYNLSKIDVEIQKVLKLKAELDIIKDVKKTYLDILLAEKILIVTKETEKALKAHESDAQKFYNQGIIPLNDLLKSQVALKNASQEKEKAKANLELGLYSFKLLISSPANQMVKLIQLDNFNIKSTHKLQTDILFQEALKQRPILKSLHQRLKILDNEKKLAQSDYYPKLNLIGSYQQDGSDPLGVDNDYSNQHNASITFQANWDIFEWGKTKNKISQSNYRKKAALKNLKIVEDHIRLEIKQAVLNLIVAQKNIKSAEEGLKQAKENWRITDHQYKQQVTTSTEVLDARSYLTQADTNYHQALHSYMTAIIVLDRAVGRKNINL